MINKPKGTNDIIPDDTMHNNIAYWHYLENIIRNKMKIYGFDEIRTPIFEDTKLFTKGIGNLDDIVNKEMYTFFDKNKRSITLKPEGTAPIIRAIIENGIHSKLLPIKYYYTSPMFRYSKPQAGRYRQFTQFGIEVIGAKKVFLDADIILLMIDLLKSFGLKNLILLINNIGCSCCRPNYKIILKKYLKQYYLNLCNLCKDRFDKNILRLFDCKNKNCKKIMSKAPFITDYLCKKCEKHFEDIKEYLDMFNVEYKIEKTLMRGLDYYTRTAFEVKINGIASQNSIAGGGRYDNLIKLLGGPDISGIGFAIGLERVLLSLKYQNYIYNIKKENKVFIAILNNDFYKFACIIMEILRRNNIISIIDVMERSLKSQFRYANKINISHVITIGENEIKKELYPLKNMHTGEEKKFLSLNEIINILKEG